MCQLLTCTSVLYIDALNRATFIVHLFTGDYSSPVNENIGMPVMDQVTERASTHVLSLGESYFVAIYSLKNSTHVSIPLSEVYAVLFTHFRSLYHICFPQVLCF